MKLIDNGDADLILRNWEIFCSRSSWSCLCGRLLRRFVEFEALEVVFVDLPSIFEGFFEFGALFGLYRMYKLFNLHPSSGICHLKAKKPFRKLTIFNFNVFKTLPANFSINKSTAPINHPRDRKVGNRLLANQID